MIFLSPRNKLSISVMGRSLSYKTFDVLVNISFILFFSDKKTKVVQELTMFQHITWPDFGIPKDLFSIFELIHAVSQINSNCMLVHCSAGVGRTGVFFAMAKLIETYHSDAHYLNIFQTVLELRKSRKFMV